MQYLVPGERWVVGGYQADFEAGDTWSGLLYGERFRGMLAKRGEVAEVPLTHRSGAYHENVRLTHMPRYPFAYNCIIAAAGSSPDTPLDQKQPR